MSYESICYFTVAIFFLSAMPDSEANTGDKTTQLIELSLEELGNVEIVSVTKQPQKLRDAASSVYVITQQDIQRAGATTIAEALRLAPNLQVARSGSNQYAISARGFNSTTANKLLVLIDGRSVYTPLFSGVFWEVQDTLMEDIERIEVISGPGATLWGANAVNGVVNIITRNAADTIGGLTVTNIGAEEKGAEFRYGARLSDTSPYRLYGKVSKHSASIDPNGSRLQDAWQLAQVGFRVDDWLGTPDFSVQGDFYNGMSEQPIFDKKTMEGGNLLSKWHRRMSNGGDLQVQAYYDYTKRIYPGIFGETLHTFDFDVQYGFKYGKQHEILLGGGFRYSNDHVQNTTLFAFLPSDRILRTSNFFIQDQIDLLPDTLNLTVGSKFEHNDYSGFDIAPNARLSWKVDDRNQLWAAVSRAIRNPSRIDTEFFAPATQPFLLAGGPNFASEMVTAYELGYRGQLSSKTMLSASTFFNVYNKLRNLERNSAGAFVLTNRMKGETYGVEIWGDTRPMNNWRLQAGYTYLHKNLRLPADTTDPLGIAAAGNDPTHQLSIRSSLDLPNNITWDMALRHVDKLPAPQVPAYTALDMRLAWKLSQQFQVALVGQNLLQPSHLEYLSVGGVPILSEVVRSVFIQAIWKY